MKKSFIFIIFLCLSSCSKLLIDELNQFDLFPSNYFYSIDQTKYPFKTDTKGLPDISGGLINGYLNLRILDSSNLKPINLSYIILNSVAGDNKKYPCDEFGNISIVDPLLYGEVTITALAPGYTKFTIFNLDSNDIQIYLSKSVNSEEQVEVRGEFTNWPRIKSDGIVDAGMMIPSMPVESILAFDIRNIIAPDVIVDIYGDRKVPGNLVLPTQKERYLFWDIELSKPEYVFPLPQGKLTDLIALSVKAPFSKLINAANNGLEITEMIKLISFERIGVQRDYLIARNNNKNINLSNQLKKSLKLNIENIPVNKEMILLSSGKFQDKTGNYFPISINIIDPKKNLTGDLYSIYQTNNFTNIDYLIGAISFDLSNESSDHAFTGEFTRSQNGSGEIFISSFLKSVKLTRGVWETGEFEFESPAVPGVSPNADLFISDFYLYDKDNNREKLWTLIMPQDRTEFVLPDIEKQLLLNKENNILWVLTAYSFKAEKNYEFSYNYFNQNIFENMISHISQNKMKLEL